MKSGEIFPLYYQNTAVNSLCVNNYAVVLLRHLVCLVTVILVWWIKVISLAGCRKCKRPSHIPQRCEEIESKEVRMRTFIENKMTDALVR